LEPGISEFKSSTQLCDLSKPHKPCEPGIHVWK
jgi:hypothetical protein